MRVVQLGDEHDLAAEPVAIHASGKVRLEHLDHDLAVERMLDGHEHPAHAAARELVLYGVVWLERFVELVAKRVAQITRRRSLAIAESYGFRGPLSRCSHGIGHDGAVLRPSA
jgi:hypothetical protein